MRMLSASKVGRTTQRESTRTKRAASSTHNIPSWICTHNITNTWRVCRHKLIITFICLPHPPTAWLFDSQRALCLCLMGRCLFRWIYCSLISSSCGMEQGVNASRLDLSVFAQYRTDRKGSVSPPVLNGTDNMKKRFLETICILCWFWFLMHRQIIAATETNIWLLQQH